MTTIPLSATALKPHLRPCTLYPNPIFPPLRQSITITHCKSSRPDSNTPANEFQRRRSWWEDQKPSEDEVDGGGAVEEVLESLWIVKIFRFYGWWLPPILISMLLATGPKAFLLALASTTGLSLSTLAFTKLLGLLDAPKPKSRARKKKKRTRGRATSNIEMDSQEEEEEEGEEYRSWVSYDDGMSDKGNKEDSSDFRGWDEIAGDEVFSGRTRRRDVRGGRRVRRERKFTRREMGGEMPLLLRLLIAVFPFLGSWTKML